MRGHENFLHDEAVVGSSGGVARLCCRMSSVRGVQSSPLDVPV